LKELYCNQNNAQFQYVILQTLYCPTNAHNVKKRGVIKTF